MCFGSVSLEVTGETFSFFGRRQEFMINSIPLLASNSSVVLAYDNLNDLIADNVDAQLSEFAADVIYNRRNESVRELLSAYPWSSEEPTTLKEFIDKETRSLRHREGK
jgi:hypothetical protein